LKCSSGHKNTFGGMAFCSQVALCKKTDDTAKNGALS